MNSQNLKYISLLLFASTLLFAEGGTSISGYNQAWGNIGMGVAMGPKMAGFGWGVGVSYYRGAFLISARYFNNSGGMGGEPLMVDPERQTVDYENMVDVGVCIGGIVKSKWGFASCAGGFGIITGDRRPIGSCLHERYTGFNLPMEAQIYLTPTPAFGIGVTLMGNINRISPTFGMMVCLQYGLLW